MTLGEFRQRTTHLPGATELRLEVCYFDVAEGNLYVGDEEVMRAQEEDDVEYCDSCGGELEPGQIGLCDACLEEPGDGSYSDIVRDGMDE